LLSEFIVIPPYEIVKNYTSIVESLYAEMLLLSQQSRALATIREAPLPKLMSGEIEVRGGK
jgi:hypothetical protein